MKFLITGIGNVGDKYAHTRHNIGFDILDRLAEKEGITFSHSRHVYKAEYKFKGRTFHLIKPTTYVNLSGKAVSYWLADLKIPVENLLVIADDIALPLGKIRIRGRGSDGGHNGLKDIIATLGTQDFPRLRFGIGDEFSKGRQVDFVLGKWNEDEQKHLPERMDIVIEAIKSFGTIGLEKTMTEFNSK